MKAYAHIVVTLMADPDLSREVIAESNAADVISHVSRAVEVDIPFINDEPSFDGLIIVQ